MPTIDEDLIKELMVKATAEIHAPAGACARVTRQRRRSRRTRRRLVTTMAMALTTAAAAIAVVTVTSAPTTSHDRATATSLVPVTTRGTAGATKATHGAGSQLIQLADYLQAHSTTRLPGNATLVLHTQSYPNGRSDSEADLYTDAGKAFSAPTVSGLRPEIATSGDTGYGLFAREIKAAEEAVSGNVAAASHKMATAPFPDGVPPTRESGLATVDQKIAAQRNLSAAQKAALEHKIAVAQKSPSVQRARTDNYIWEDSLDALIAGAGNPQVRIGVLRILATLPHVKVMSTTTGGQPTLTLTASSPTTAPNYKEALTINATSGVPVSFAGRTPGHTPSVSIAYHVSRVTVAEIEAGKS